MRTPRNSWGRGHHESGGTTVNTTHSMARILAFLVTTSLLLLGPVAFGTGASSADEPLPDEAVSAPLQPGDPLLEIASTEVGAEAEPVGHDAGEDGDEGTGEHGTGDEGEHGEETAQLVCLATGDPEAPYTGALVMPTAIISGEGRIKMEGPAYNQVEGIFPAEVWGNIVPELTHPSGATFAGLNFGEAGRAIWEEGCGLDDPGTPPDDGHGQGGHGGHATVIVCTATDDSVTPYEVEEWMVQEIINGHGMPKKDGPASDPIVGVFPDGVWGNIIPVVTHPNKKATYPGLNLEDGGQAILDADCVYVVPTPPAPALAPAPPARDFCPDLDGMQWENYDCNTPQASAADVALPVEPAAVDMPTPALAPTPTSAAMPAEVSVPTQQTLPSAVDAGSAPASPTGSPIWAILVLLAACIGASATAARVAFSEPA